MKILDLLWRTPREEVYLLRGKTYSPEDSVIPLGLKGQIERLQTFGIFEGAQVLLDPGQDESHSLCEHLDERARPTPLFRQGGRVTIYILEAVFVVLGGELSDGAV